MTEKIMPVNCTNCLHVQKQQQIDGQGHPVFGQYLHTCHFNPPQIVVLPLGGGGIRMDSMSPRIVTGKQA